MSQSFTWEKEISIKDEKELSQFAHTFGSQLGAGMTVGLSGDLGAGKTTFVRYLCASLGVEVPVSSPTYILMHEYPVGDDYLIEHWDLYRLTELPEELTEPNPKRLRLIEWPDHAPELYESIDILISYTVIDESQRTLQLQAKTPLANL